MTLNMAVTTPIPTPSVSAPVSAKPGERPSSLDPVRNLIRHEVPLPECLPAGVSPSCALLGLGTSTVGAASACPDSARPIAAEHRSQDIAGILLIGIAEVRDTRGDAGQPRTRSACIQQEAAGDTRSYPERDARVVLPGGAVISVQPAARNSS